jgi:hypothetical protein
MDQVESIDTSDLLTQLEDEDIIAVIVEMPNGAKLSLDDAVRFENDPATGERVAVLTVKSTLSYG